jgi:hypothetical protein
MVMVAPTPFGAAEAAVTGFGAVVLQPLAVPQYTPPAGAAERVSLSVQYRVWAWEADAIKSEQSAEGTHQDEVFI